MYKILIISSKQNNSIDIIKPQIQYLENHCIQVDLAVDLTRLELIEKITHTTYDCAYIHIKRRYSNIKNFEYAYDSAKILEHYNITVIGNNYLSQLMLADKFWTSKHSGIGLNNLVINRDEYINNCINYDIIEKSIEYPMIVKPNTLHSSEGISQESVVYDKNHLKKAINKLFDSYCNLYEILVEAYADNAIEYTVSVLGNAKGLACSVSRLDFNSDITIRVNSEAEKNLPLSERCFKFSVEDNSDIRKRLEYHAKTLFEHFKLKDYARFDFIYKNQSVYLLEANSCPVPGNSFSWEWQQKYNLKKEQIIALYLSAFHFGQIANFKLDALPNELINSLPQEIIGKINNPGIFNTIPECSGPVSNCKFPFLYSMNDRIGSELEVHIFLKALTRLLKPQFILETGTYKGNSTIAFAEGLRENGFGHLVSIEIDNRLANRAKKMLKNYPVEIINNSSLKYIPHEPIDLLFLDSKRILRKQEFNYFKKWLHKESIIVWHDSAYREKNPAVYNALKELCSDGALTYITFPTPRGLTISKINK